jgi:hypothetical protein
VRALILLTAVAFAACADPIRDEKIAALGGEAPGVRHGPLHRPGQPCLLCHEPSGGGNQPALSVAGTIYAVADKATPVNNVEVRLVDADGRRFTALSNCAGNFYVQQSEWAPRYPLWTTVAAEGQTIDMESAVYRDGSCASCHTDPKNPTSAGHVFLLDDGTITLPAGYYCQ